MRWRIRDVEISANCMGATFSLTGVDRVECFEGVESFKYLGRILHQAHDDWPEVLCNIWRARKVLERLGKLLRQERADLRILAKFYRAVVQAVLLLGLETWVLMAAMLQNIEGLHVSFLRQMTGMKDQRLGDETWRKEKADRMLQAAGTKPLQEYTNKRQEKVAEWGTLRPILKVCAKETRYE